MPSDAGLLGVLYSAHDNWKRHARCPFISIKGKVNTYLLIRQRIDLRKMMIMGVLPVMIMRMVYTRACSLEILKVYLEFEIVRVNKIEPYCRVVARLSLYIIGKANIRSGFAD